MEREFRLERSSFSALSREQVLVNFGAGREFRSDFVWRPRVGELCEDALTEAIIQLASEYGRYGDRRITAELQ